MKCTTLCYIEKDGKTLLLHRTKKQSDESAGKWIGIGGKLENGESPEDCLLREVKEETGFTLKRFCFRAVITFCSDEWGTECMFLFTSDSFDGTLVECDEGDLAWVDNADTQKLPMWEGDIIFLSLLRSRDSFFSLKLCYTGEKLTSAFLDGNKLNLNSYLNGK